MAQQGGTYRVPASMFSSQPFFINIVSSVNLTTATETSVINWTRARGHDQDKVNSRESTTEKSEHTSSDQAAGIVSPLLLVPSSGANA
jgi:hypothetical protein